MSTERRHQLCADGHRPVRAESDWMRNGPSSTALRFSRTLFGLCSAETPIHSGGVQPKFVERMRTACVRILTANLLHLTLALYSPHILRPRPIRCNCKETRKPRYYCGATVEKVSLNTRAARLNSTKSLDLHNLFLHACEFRGTIVRLWAR